ncbi:MAG: hypothetical protein WCT14_13195 [Treponemataceae bacterium]
MTVICALTVFLYGIGTAQDFLESTQLGLLRLAAVLGLLLSVGSAYGLILDIVYSVFFRLRHFFWGAVAYCVSAVFGIAVALLSNGILVLVSGNVS